MVLKDSVRERRQKLKELIGERGLWNINKSEIGREFNVSPTQINRDVELILQEIPEENVKELVHEMRHMFKHAIKTAERNLDSKDSSIQLKAVNSLVNSMSNFTQFLEAWGKKPKIPDRMDINQDSTVIFFFDTIDQYDFLEWAKRNRRKDILEAYDGFKKAKVREKTGCKNVTPFWEHYKKIMSSNEPTPQQQKIPLETVRKYLSRNDYSADDRKEEKLEAKPEPPKQAIVIATDGESLTTENKQVIGVVTVDAPKPDGILCPDCNRMWMRPKEANASGIICKTCGKWLKNE